MEKDVSESIGRCTKKYDNALRALADNKDMVVCIVGESGSGKTTLVNGLKEINVYNVIDSYTTRPERYEGEPGHIFLKEGDCIVRECKIGSPDIYTRNEDGTYSLENSIAYTKFHGHHYWATKKQYRGKEISLYVIDPDGVDLLRCLVDDAKVLVIYLALDEETRVERMKARGDDDAEERAVHDRTKFHDIDYDYAMASAMGKDDLVLAVDDIIQYEYSQL